MTFTEFKDRVAIVTGGASGIGLATVQRLASLGARVVVVDLAAPASDTDGQIARHIRLDVCDHEAVEAAVAAIEAEIGPVAYLVNCAGIVQDPLAPADLDPATFARVHAISFGGTYAMCRAAGTAMARRGRGAIVNIASVAGMRSMPLHAYSPAKAAVIALTEGLAGEWGRSGVRVNCVSPGYTLTAALQGQIDKGLRDPARLQENTALGALINPDDIAAAIQFLLSEAAGKITGVNLPVDAGWLISGSWNTFGGVRRPLPNRAGAE